MACPDGLGFIQFRQATDYKEKFEPLLKKGATLGLSHGFLLGESRHTFDPGQAGRCQPMRGFWDAYSRRKTRAGAGCQHCGMCWRMVPDVPGNVRGGF